MQLNLRQSTEEIASIWSRFLTHFIPFEEAVRLIRVTITQSDMGDANFDRFMWPLVVTLYDTKEELTPSKINTIITNLVEEMNHHTVIPR